MPLFNRAHMTVSGAPGTGVVTLGAAAALSVATFAEAGVVNGASDIPCVFEDGDDFELSRCTYSSVGPTLTRDTVIMSRVSGVHGTTKLNLSSAATVFIDPFASDILTPDGNLAGLADVDVALDNLGFGAKGKQLVASADEAAALAQLPSAYHRGNILGTVSQSGGYPTGAIIERGSNANGEYIRWADGTQICYRISRLPAVALNNGTSVTCVFAAAFANTNYHIQYSAMTEIGAGGQSATGAVYDNGVYAGVYGTGQFNLNCYAYRRAVPNPVDFFVSVIGRWF